MNTVIIQHLELLTDAISDISVQLPDTIAKDYINSAIDKLEEALKLLKGMSNG